MLSALLVLAAVAPTQFNFYSYGPYDPGVPKPEAILGYGPGEKESTYFQQEEVVKAEAEHAKDRVVYIRYGTSTEGRPLRVLAISSPENIRNLEAIRKDIAALASGASTKTEEITKHSPAIIWINECIHGDEPASFEASMWLLYNLAASRNTQITTFLKNTVVILNPCYNTDGHERFVVWYNSVATGSASPDAPEQHEPRNTYGRLNHYRFDMNRDRIAMSQAETKQEVAEYLKWNPQVYVDQHGQVSTYFFPPASLSVNANVDRDRYNKWADIFGHAAGAAFDQQGFSYYIKDVFDLYYPGYLDSWTTLNGAIGMTNETDGGHSIRSMREDGSTATLRGSMARHFTASLAYISATSLHREELLRAYAKFKLDSMNTQIGRYKFLTLWSKNQVDIDRLQKQVESEGVQCLRCSPGAYLKFHDGLDLWTGKPINALDVQTNYLSIPLGQPQGHLVKSLFDPAADFEPAFLKEQIRRKALADGEEKYPGADSAEFYDFTGWNPAFAANVNGVLTEVDPVQMELIFMGHDFGRTRQKPTVGYISPPSEMASLTTADLLKRGVHIDVTTQQMGDPLYPAGSFIIFRDRNQDNLDEEIESAEKERGSHPFQFLETSYPTSGRQGAGSESVHGISKVKIGVLFGDDASPTQYSGIWFAMDHTFHLPYTPLTKSALGGDLSEYSCIIFPRGQYQITDKVKDWISSGGCAVVLGAQNWAVADYAHLEAVKGQVGELPGSLFRAELNPRSFLSYGYAPHEGADKTEMAVLVEGDTFYKAKAEGGGAVTMSKDEDAKKLLSGWEWPDDTEKNLAGTVWVHDQPVGRGHVIIFMHDPTDRAMWPGFNKMLLNAILLGPNK
ncbi:MAG TPA: M14 family zinc carboxypeptidase [Fimbriimonadaceae bacterium]|jgi:hypothetical protein